MSEAHSHGTHSYFDWQVSTLMLADDVIEPIPRTDHARLAKRQDVVHQEIHAMAQSAIPQTYRENPQLEFPPAVVILLTKATLKRAAEIVGI